MAAASSTRCNPQSNVTCLSTFLKQKAKSKKQKAKSKKQKVKIRKALRWGGGKGKIEKKMQKLKSKK